MIKKVQWVSSTRDGGIIRHTHYSKRLEVEHMVDGAVWIRLDSGFWNLSSIAHFEVNREE